MKMDSISVMLLIVIALGWFFKYHWKRRNLRKLAACIPSTDFTWFPFIGQAYTFLGSGESRMTVFKKIGREALNNQGMIRFWFGQRLFIVISEPKSAEVIMKKCLEKDSITENVKDLTGNGLIFAPVSIWRPRRKIMIPTFSPKYITQFSNIFIRQSEILAEKLSEKCGVGDFSIWPYLSSYTMDSVFETNLGVSLNSQRSTNHPFLKAFENSLRVVGARVCQPWLHPYPVYRMTSQFNVMDKAKKNMYGFIEQVIRNKRETLKNEKKHPSFEGESTQMKTFLDLLIEKSGDINGYTDTELREEIMVIALAGIDTSAVGASFIVGVLAKHPEIQEKVYQELCQILTSGERSLVNEDLTKMPYLDAVIKESLRLYPPGPVIVREVTDDVTLPSGLTLIPGVGILINIWAMHRNPLYWGEDAEVFKPERFLGNTTQNPAFMPFSYGPRNCVGYQYAMASMKLAVANILLKYKLLPKSTKYPVNSTDNDIFRVQFDIMMKDVDNFMIRLEKR